MRLQEPFGDRASRAGADAPLAPWLSPRATRQGDLTTLDPCGGCQRVPQTSTTFPTQYMGRLVFKPIMAELTNHARREGLELNVATRRWLFTIVTTITVSGDVNAVERFGWIIDRITSRYSMITAMC